MEDLNLHSVQLDLRHGQHDGQPVTIDGFPLRNVTDVKVDAPASKLVVVTVSFLAEVTTSAPPTLPDQLMGRRPVTNGA